MQRPVRSRPVHPGWHPRLGPAQLSIYVPIPVCALWPLRLRPLQGYPPQPWRSPRAPPRPPAPCASARPASRCAPTAATASAGLAWFASGRRRTGPSLVPSAPMTAGNALWSPAGRRSAAACWHSRRQPQHPRAMARPRRRRCSCCVASTGVRSAPPAEWRRGRSHPSGSPAGGRCCAARCARAVPVRRHPFPDPGALTAFPVLWTMPCYQIP